jgi:Zn-dependent M28 family amino/carboxypeptidase
MRILTAQAIMLLFSCSACAETPRADVPQLNAETAMEHVRAQVAFGPRPPGSEALRKCREYLIAQLRSYGYQVEEDAFEANTPYGPKKMVNLIARTGEGSGNRGIVAIGSHYDAKLMQGIHFVGANDGASSTGLLLELARVLRNQSSTIDYWFLFLDGEEAFIDWSTFDSTYGSRHLARRWKREGVASRVKAFILLDMIGDKNLDIMKEANSTRWLSDLVWEAAAKAGLASILSPVGGAIEDDHLPFLDAGIPSVDIIDLNYGPGNSFHHTAEDTLDKVSVESLEKTGRLVLTLLPMLEARLTGQ